MDTSSHPKPSKEQDIRAKDAPSDDNLDVDESLTRVIDKNQYLLELLRLRVKRLKKEMESREP